MGLFDFVRYKKERCNVDGREIIIIDKSKLNKEKFKKLHKIILEICSNYKIAKYLPKIEFHIKHPKHGNKIEEVNVEDKDYIVGWVDPRDLIDERFIVYLNPEYLESKKIKTNIAHEIAHIWHDYSSKIMSNKIEESDKLHDAIFKINKRFNEKTRSLRDHREFLFFYFRSIHTEGLAKFCEAYAIGDVLMSEKNFNEIYKTTKQLPEMIFDLWNSYLRKLGDNNEKERKDRESLLSVIGEKISTYDIGQHIIYSLLYLDHNLTIEKIAKLSFFKFIKKYEESMKSKNLKPLVSISSGEGILDYNRMLNQWWMVCKKLKFDKADD